MDGPVEIPVREMPFEFGGHVPCVWDESIPERCYKTHALSLEVAFLEPYFIATIKEAAERVADEELAERAIAFCGQEANHSRQHTHFNRTLKQSGYPGLEKYEKQIQRSLVRSRQEHSLAYRLAYTAGFEALTLASAERLFEKDLLHVLDKAPPSLVAMWVWHAVEEVEHKSVAFEMFQAVHGGYALRCRGLLAALKKTADDMRGPVAYMIEQDGRTGDPELERRMRRGAWEDAREIIPRLLPYFRPGYHPNQHTNPSVVARWRDAHASGKTLLEVHPRDVLPSVES